MNIIDLPISETSSSTPAEVLILDVPCDPSVYEGAAVYKNGDVAYNAIANNASTANFIGIAETKTSPVLCNLRVLGVTPEIYSSLDQTKDYVLSDTVPGLITTTQVGPGNFIVPCGQPFSDKRFLVKKGNITKRAL